MLLRLHLIFAVTLIASAPASAHDLYLVSGIAGAENKVCARIGERFPASMNSVSSDRVELFQIRNQQGTTPLAGKEDEKQFCAPRPNSGAALAEMVVHPRFIKLAAADFNSYISGEGLTTVMLARERSQKNNAEGRELYSRYSKLLIGSLEDLATRPIGHALEIVPEKDPAILPSGASFVVQVLFQGKPLSGARVSAVYAGYEAKGHDFPVTAETDRAGKATLKVDRPGLWYARLIHMRPAQNDPDVDWRSFFATLTFEIPEH